MLHKKLPSSCLSYKYFLETPLPCCVTSAHNNLLLTIYCHPSLGFIKEPASRRLQLYKDGWTPKLGIIHACPWPQSVQQTRLICLGLHAIATYDGCDIPESS
jgi:hypothetical protein